MPPMALTRCLGKGAAGVGLLSTIIAAPVVVALEAAALACGLASIAGKYVSRRLLVKAKKHDEIRVIALPKLDSITGVISNALRDGHISPEEFKLVLGYNWCPPFDPNCSWVRLHVALLCP